MFNIGTRGGQLLALAHNKRALIKNDKGSKKIAPSASKLLKLSSDSDTDNEIETDPFQPFMEISPKKQLIEQLIEKDLFDDDDDDEGNDNLSFKTGDLNLLMGDVTKVLEKYNHVPLPNANKDFEFIEYVDFSKEPLTTTESNVKNEASVANTSEITEQEKGDDKVKRKRKAKTLEEKARPVLEPCSESCRRKCTEKINEDRRISINKQYWGIDYNRQRDWLLNNVKEVAVKQVRVNEEKRKRDRSKSFEYFLPNSNRDLHQVCQKFFLRTLGYSNNKKIEYLFRNVSMDLIASQPDQRGRHEPPNKISEDIIKKIDCHILSANPTTSHYRRKHAPLRLYLPSELNISMLHQFFIESNPNLNVKYDFYRKRINHMNVSFAKLGLEDCESCIAQTQHRQRGLVEKKFCNNNIDFLLGKLINDVECQLNECESCSDYKQHAKLYKTARSEYLKDKIKVHSDEEMICATDMQKVVMLPRMPGVKACIFTRRLTTYHMTFAPIGGKQSKPVGVIWHDAIRGRNDEDVTSTYIKYINYVRKERITIWVDNCSAQNKNWTLYTVLCRIVNDPSSDCQEIILKYFEPGHTFMAADSFHKEIEDGMRCMKNVYDFNDFEQIIQMKGISLRMAYSDFKRYESKLSKGKNTHYPLLEKIVVAKFIKGSEKLYWKEDMEEKEFQEGKFLQKKFVEVMKLRDPFLPQTSNKGFPKEKKDDVLLKLCPLMPESRQLFWKDILKLKITNRN